MTDDPIEREPASDAELDEAFRRLPDPEARDVLARRFLPLAEHLAHRFAGRGESEEDLRQVASLGLVHAIDRFDPDREVRFSTFATVTIVGELKRHFRDKGWSVRVPRQPAGSCAAGQPGPGRALAGARTFADDAGAGGSDAVCRWTRSWRRRTPCVPTRRRRWTRRSVKPGPRRARCSRRPDDAIEVLGRRGWRSRRRWSDCRSVSAGSCSSGSSKG